PKLCASKQRKGERAIVVGAGSAAEEEIAGTVREVGPVEVQPVGGKEARQLWNEYVQRYHPLGYKRPFGAHQRYFLVGRGGRRMGCLLFASSAWALRERDAWIGWTERDRQQRLNWVVANTRFLIFPWVRVRNLASKALSLAAQRIRKDWEERWRAAKELRKRQAAEGLESPPTGTIGNGMSPWKTVEEEQQARQEAVEEQIQAYRSALPTLLKRLGKIRDPRNPKTIRHKST